MKTKCLKKLHGEDAISHVGISLLMEHGSIQSTGKCSFEEMLNSCLKED